MLDSRDFLELLENEDVMSSDKDKRFEVKGMESVRIRRRAGMSGFWGFDFISGII